MACDRCAADAIVHQAYSGSHLCGTHLRRSVERRVKKRIREDGLIDDDATPLDPAIWVIGLSGGKDSAVLTDIVHRTLAEDPRIELVALTIHEGIEGYRDASLAACRTLADDRDIRHEVRTYAEEYGIQMDDVATSEAAPMAPCAYCGVFRRDILERVAGEFDADLLLTGHNLDDEAQTALMNVFSGDVDQMAKHYEASLGPLDERRSQTAFVPRAKPLRDIPEREIALYAHTAELPVHFSECPHASEAFRGEVQSLLLDLETNHPGTRHSIIAGYEDLAKLAAKQRDANAGPDLQPCSECGSQTTGAVCRKCELLDRLSTVTESA